MALLSFISVWNNWSNKFSLLGIEFSNNLEGMEKNFNDKLEKLGKMLSCWIYRYITPYGKVTMALALYGKVTIAVAPATMF